jgi:uncharacterized protein
MRRVVSFPLVRLIVILVIFGALTAPLTFLLRPPLSPPRVVALNWIAAALLFAVMAGVERFTVRKSLSAIGFDPRHAARDLFLGVTLGTALFSAVILELTLAGFYRVTAVHVTYDLAVAALLLVADAAIEELLFRGVLFRLVEEWAGTWIALAISAAIFGLAHAANPGATWLSSLAIALEAGILLGAAFVVTKNLWFPIGLHFAWNFCEGPVFGTSVSGHTFLTSALSARLAGPAILTGGRFGPEAGLAAMLTCVAAAVALVFIAKARSLIVPPSWKRQVRASAS